MLKGTSTKKGNKPGRGNVGHSTEDVIEAIESRGSVSGAAKDLGITHQRLFQILSERQIKTVGLRGHGGGTKILPLVLLYGLLMACSYEGDRVVDGGSPTEPGRCGDGDCAGGETMETCPTDCGEPPDDPPPPPPTAVCGNRDCETGLGENADNCSRDCCQPPAVNQATVVAQLNGVCSTLPCFADGLQPTSSLRRTVWESFSSLCNPALTTSFRVTFSCGATDSAYTFRNLACTSEEGDDPSNRCCRAQDITVRFTEPDAASVGGS